MTFIIKTGRLEHDMPPGSSNERFLKMCPMSRASTPADGPLDGSATKEFDHCFEKNALLLDLMEQLRADLARLVRTQSDTHEAATHEENRAEHAKDTRATEQSYLARGLAGRVEDLRRAVHRLSGLELTDFDSSHPIGLTAVVRVEDDETKSVQIWWLVPAGGGIEIRSGERRIRTITPAAPLGRALIGLSIGDEGAYETPRGTRSFQVLGIA
jgi:transcription elongation GreA/GreB family factor